MINSNLRFNMTGAERDPVLRAARYRTALDMAAYADAQGFASVNLEEHHVAENGWLPSPLTMAAAIAGRTERVRIGVMALLVSLYDPIRLAEDIAVIDLLSEGRLSFIAGMGYREVEFHIANKPFAERGAWMDPPRAGPPAWACPLRRPSRIQCWKPTTTSSWRYTASRGLCTHPRRISRYCLSTRTRSRLGGNWGRTS